MATQAIPGYTGQIYASTDGGTTWNPVGEAREATLNVSTDELDATSFDSVGWKEYIPGMKEWTCDTENLYVRSNAGQQALWTTLVAGAKLNLRLLPKIGTGNIGYTGQAFITSWEIGEPVDDIVSLSVSFRGTSALAEYTAT